MMVDFASLAQQCAPNVNPTTLQALVKTESGFNPYAIGVVGGHLERQPRSAAEAIATVKALDARGVNFSMGLGQVNKVNLPSSGLNYETVFDACANLQAGGNILADCYRRAAAKKGQGTDAVYAAFSCYYSGNFTRGFQRDFRGTSYVQRVASNAQDTKQTVSVVPAIPVVLDKPASRKVDAPKDRQTSEPTSTSPEGKPESSDRRPSWDAFGDFSGSK
jgi:type IV secretion system protein VirB1